MKIDILQTVDDYCLFIFVCILRFCLCLHAFEHRFYLACPFLCYNHRMHKKKKHKLYPSWAQRAHNQEYCIWCDGYQNPIVKLNVPIGLNVYLSSVPVPSTFRCDSLSVCVSVCVCIYWNACHHIFCCCCCSYNNICSHIHLTLFTVHTMRCVCTALSIWAHTYMTTTGVGQMKTRHHNTIYIYIYTYM